MLSGHFEKFLEDILGVKFKNIEYYKQAFVHPSFSSKNNYQRLEFLGDAVISLAVSHLLFFKYEMLGEGELTKLRMSIVRKEVLSEVSKKLGFKKYVHLGKGEERDSGREKESILADVFEAFIGAVYLDLGFIFVLDWIRDRLSLFLEAGEEIRDYKSLLQEIVQGKKIGSPVYVVSKEEGVAHKKEFFVDLYIAERKVASGSGKSKKLAEQNAAKSACQILSNEKT